MASASGAVEWASRYYNKKGGSKREGVYQDKQRNKGKQQKILRLQEKVKDLEAQLQGKERSDSGSTGDKDKYSKKAKRAAEYIALMLSGNE